jgi:hypothetical protein
VRGFLTTFPGSTDCLGIIPGSSVAVNNKVIIDTQARNMVSAKKV